MLVAYLAQVTTQATQMLADASVDVLVYACLVALMAEGARRPSPGRAAASDAVLAAEGHSATVVSSAGALVDTLQLMGARKIAVVAPYLPALTQRVCDYIAAEGVVVEEARSLSVAGQRRGGPARPAAPGCSCRIRTPAQCGCGGDLGVRADAVAQSDRSGRSTARPASHLFGNGPTSPSSHCAGLASQYPYSRCRTPCSQAHSIQPTH